MKYIRLGNTGLRVSRICLGTMTYGSPKWREWVLPESESRPFIQGALEAGINFFDTADMYSLGESEVILGRALNLGRALKELVYYQDSDFQVVDRVVELAQQRGVAPAQIALAWLLHQPGVTAPIIGASKMHHLDDALASLEIELTEEECQRLEEPYQPHPVLEHH